jgi:hypothetical protein
MVRAVKAVTGEEIVFLKASKLFSVPRATLKYCVNGRVKEAEDLVAMRIGRKLVLPVQNEN